MLALKTAPQVCIGLLVCAEIVARSPLSVPLKGCIHEEAVLKKRKSQSAGPAQELPGLRPLPSFYNLQLRTEPPTAPPADAPSAATPPGPASAAPPRTPP